MRSYTCRACGVSGEAPGRRGRVPSLCGECRRKRLGSGTCEACGKPLVRHGRRFCSARCFHIDSRVYVPATSCEVCGVAFIRRNGRFCSVACSAESQRKQQPATTCEECGAQFSRERRGNDARRFCGHGCAYAAQKRKADERRQQQAVQKAARDAVIEAKRTASIAVCPICVATYRRKQRQQKTCSRECSHIFRRGRPCYTRKMALQASVCQDCGVSVMSLRSRLRCDRCAKRHTKKQDKKRLGKCGIDRARKRGLPRDYSVTSIRVFMRDGWRCQLCGVSTPRRLRGKQSPQSPEVDHIIPIAMGGGHVWSNVQTACRACNAAKGASVKGQLRLAV